MSKAAITKSPVKEREPIEPAESFERRIQEENNARFQELRDQAQATLAAVKGSRAIRGPNGGHVSEGQDWLCERPLSPRAAWGRAVSRA